MRIYSDILNESDLYETAPAGCYVERVTIGRPRVRGRGWNVRLVCPGAGEQGAASWDQHGEWIARLFRRDPNARIANYDGQEEFHAVTDSAYVVTR